ncbi:splicing regulatory glutamine/lysine-rich protein 1-like isoform X2 [Dendropsophus ebraccatus]
MNMFDSESPPFRIPAKICFVKFPPEEAVPPEEAALPGLGDKKINVSDQARESDICSKLIEQVKRDVNISDGEEESTDSRSLAKDRGKSKGRREENMSKMQSRKDGDEQKEWAKAKEKVEEFLDFPGVMAAMAYRNQEKSKGSSRNSSRNGGGLASRGEPEPIPNTRHNAIFLRDHEKAAEAVRRNPQKSKQPSAVDSHQPATKSRDHGTKKVEKSNSHVDNIVAESDTGTQR